jgi:hypothetical protein
LGIERSFFELEGESFCSLLDSLGDSFFFSFVSFSFSFSFSPFSLGDSFFFSFSLTTLFLPFFLTKGYAFLIPSFP